MPRPFHRPPGAFLLWLAGALVHAQSPLPLPSAWPKPNAARLDRLDPAVKLQAATLKGLTAKSLSLHLNTYLLSARDTFHQPTGSFIEYFGYTNPNATGAEQGSIGLYPGGQGTLRLVAFKPKGLSGSAIVNYIITVSVHSEQPQTLEFELHQHGVEGVTRVQTSIQPVNRAIPLVIQSSRPFVEVRYKHTSATAHLGILGIEVESFKDS